MNKHQRMFLRILGILILAIGILITLYFYINSDVKANILTADYVCNSDVGQLTQNLLQKQSDCRNIHLFSFFINYNWLFYVIGLLLFLFGVWSGLGGIKK